MFDLGMMELLLIGVVALIVVGPKDLPVMFRNVGRFTGKMKGMAREFTRAMNDAADETGVKDIKSDLTKLTSPKTMAMGKMSDAAKSLVDWDVDAASERASKRGPETARMTEERAENARRIRERTAEVAQARLDREAAAASAAAEEADEPEPGDPLAPATSPATSEPPAAAVPPKEARG